MALPSNRTYLPSSWKQWIAENLLRGGTAADLVPILVKEGFPEALAQLEVDAAISHPYLAAAASLGRQKQKCDWVLHTLRRLRAMEPEHGIPRLETIEADEFFRSFYHLNRPLVLTGAMENWPALERWSAAYLVEKVGDRQVEIRGNRKSGARSESLRYQARFPDFVQMVFVSGEPEDISMTANGEANAAVLEALAPDVGELSGLLDTTIAGSHRSLWIAAAGIVAPAQHDLRNNLVAQVIGRRRIRLVAPENLPLLYNHRHCYSMVDFESIDFDRFPLMRDVQVHEVTLDAGDVLFLPVGWWHHQRGLDATIAVTFSNFRCGNRFHDNDCNEGAI